MSSTIYFGFPAAQSKSKKVNVSPALKEKGIELLRASPSLVTVIAKPLMNAHIWTVLIGHISAVIQTISVKASVPLNLPGYWISSTHPNPIPVAYPNLSLTVKNISSDNAQWLMDRGFEEQMIRNESTWLLINPDSDTLQLLSSDKCPVRFNSTSYAPYSYANMSALSNFSMIRNILSYLVQGLQNPVFDSDVNPSEFVPIAISDTTQESVMEVDQQTRDEASNNSPKALSARSPLSKIFSVSDAKSTPMPQDTVDGTGFASQQTFFSINGFSASNLTAGVLLRYVADLSDDDRDGVPNFISRYLMRTLGDNFEEQLSIFTELKSSWGVLRTTSSGHILSHIVKCLEISIDAQCGIKLIFDNGFYEGAVLQGYGYSLYSQGRLWFPASPANLFEDLYALETHAMMQEIITKAMSKGGIPTENIPDDFESMNDIRKLLLKGKFNDETRKLIKDAAQKLRFPYNKWSVNLGSIMKLVTIVAKGNDIIEDDYPIGPEGLFSDDPIEIALSCFPKEGCPSFRHPSGTPIDLRAKKAPAPPSDIKRKGGKGPQQINNGGWIFSIRRVEYSEAVVDFRHLLRESEARSMGSSAAKGLGCFVLSGGNFEKVFYALKDCLTKVSDETGVNPELKSTDVTGFKRVGTPLVNPPTGVKKLRQFF